MQSEEAILVETSYYFLNQRRFMSSFFHPFSLLPDITSDKSPQAFLIHVTDNSRKVPSILFHGPCCTAQAHGICVSHGCVNCRHHSEHLKIARSRLSTGANDVLLGLGILYFNYTTPIKDIQQGWRIFPPPINYHRPLHVSMPARRY